VQPILDYSELKPGQRATDAIRGSAKSLGLTPDNGVTIRLTGAVPLADEEFATLEENAGLMAGVMLSLVVLALWLAVRSFTVIGCILLTLGVGLMVTTGFGLLIYGSFNLISVAFIPLFVGLGVDFGIQFCVRYRSECRTHDDREDALVTTGHSLGYSLGLAAVATMVGFFAFLPTDYVGISQLGLIAGVGMIVAFLLSISLLPAMLKLVDSGGSRGDTGYASLAPADAFLHAHRRHVLYLTGVLAVLCVIAIPFLRFDFNPLNLRSAKTESVATMLDLMADPDTTPNTIEILSPSLDTATALAERL